MGSGTQTSRRVQRPDDENISTFLLGWSGGGGSEVGDAELLRHLHPQLLWLSHSERLSPIPVGRGHLTLARVKITMVWFQLFRGERLPRTVLGEEPGLLLGWPGVSADEGEVRRVV